MRALAAAVLAVLLAAASADLARAQPPSAAQKALGSALRRTIQTIGGAGGAEVIDLNTGQSLFSEAAGTPRLPASVEKLYTTSTALLRFGSSATLKTTVLGTGRRDAGGTWHGTLYLRGGGDPTLGAAAFDRSAYGTGATMGHLVSRLLRATAIKALRGRVVGDESYFDSLRGTSESGYRTDYYMEGLLSALAFDRGFTTFSESTFQRRPALFATQHFVSALSGAGVAIPSRTPVYTGRTPGTAHILASVSSPPIGTLIRLTNTPSDNFFAEMLLKGLGARFAGAGSTAAGATVVRLELGSRFGLHPRLVDGSGLSRDDATSPREVVALLAQMANNQTFVRSLAVAGETGTLQDEMRGTIAQGRCHGKTGTLSDVANLAGYCQGRDGHTLAFAFLINSVTNPYYVHRLEAGMAVSVAGYDG